MKIQITGVPKKIWRQIPNCSGAKAAAMILDKDVSTILVEHSSRVDVINILEQEWQKLLLAGFEMEDVE